MSTRFLVFDARTFEPQAEVPVVDGLSFTEVLNSPGSFKATIPLLQPAGSSLSSVMIRPPNAIFAIERADVIIHAGWIWGHDYDIESGTISIAGEGVLSTIRRRVLRDTQTFTAVNQETIAWTLIDLAQNEYRGDLGIIDRRQNSGVLRDRTYWFYERKKIGELLEQLAAVDDGFDFRFTPTWTAGVNSTLGFYFDTTYPATGRATDLAFELGANCNIPSATLDGTSIAYGVDALGQGQGEQMPIVTQYDMGLLGANIRLDDTVSVSDVSDTATLESYAKRRLARGAAPIVIPRIEVDPSLLGTIILGDRLTVTIDYGLLSETGPYRVTQTDYEIPATGAERLTLSLAPLEVF